MIRVLRAWRGLRLRVVEPAALQPAEVDAIWAFCATMIDRRRDEFEATLRRCDIGVVVERRGAVVGFSATITSPGEVNGQAVRVLEARWAWLAPEVRGAHLPPVLTAVTWWRLRRRHPREPFYGILVAATEQSFVMLHRYTPRAWPHPDRPTPPDVEALLHRALPAHVGDSWDPDAGVVRGHRRWSYRVPQRQPRSDPELARLVAWYHEKNPGQGDGDCLPMVTPLDAPNLATIAWRALRGR